MSGADPRQTFTIDLPDQEAALALAGEAEATLRRIEALTGGSLVLRGLQLMIQGRPSPLDRSPSFVSVSYTPLTPPYNSVS